MPLKETRSPSEDKGVPSEPEDTNSLRMTTMHSQTETTIVISPKADKCDITQLSLDKRAQDKNEEEDGIKTPPPLFKKSPEDNKEGSRSPASQEKMDAAKERTRQQRVALEISSSSEGGRQLPKKKDQTGQWYDRNNRDKSAAQR